MRHEREGKIGLGGCLFILIAGIGICIAISTGDPPKVDVPMAGPQPSVRNDAPTPRIQSIAIGEDVIVELPGSTWVWLASEGAWNEMLDAQNAGSDELMNRLIEQGRVIRAASGSRGILVKNGVTSRLVRLTEEPFIGREGWIQTEFTRRP